MILLTFPEYITQYTPVLLQKYYRLFVQWFCSLKYFSLPLISEIELLRSLIQCGGKKFKRNQTILCGKHEPSNPNNNLVYRIAASFMVQRNLILELAQWCILI